MQTIIENVSNEQLNSVLLNSLVF